MVVNSTRHGMIYFFMYKITGPLISTCTCMGYVTTFTSQCGITIHRLCTVVMYVRNLIFHDEDDDLYQIFKR